MTIPTLQWLPTNLTGALGSYQAWDLSSRDAEAMVNDLMTVLKVYVPATTTFNLATVYNQATPTADNIPARSVALAVVGTSAAGGFTEAQSATFNFKTLGNGDVKLVLLDAPIGGAGFNAVHAAAFGATELALEAEFIAVTNAWSGRDDTKPSTMRKITFDLNDKLQKAYRMGE